jgi:hypothetical protein
MKWLAQLVAAAAVLTTPLTAPAQSLTEAQARAVIAPWSIPTPTTVRGIRITRTSLSRQTGFSPARGLRRDR